MKKIAPFFTALALASTPVFANDDTITIAVAGPMTGPAAAYGEQMRAGANTATNIINAQGGINGRNIVLQFEDDACSEAQAVNVAQRIVGANIRYVIGHFCSNATMPASAVYNEEGIFQITLSQSTEITNQGFNKLFRITPNADEIAFQMVETITKNLDSGYKLAILSHNSEYGLSLKRGTLKNLEIKNIIPTYDDTFTKDSDDFSALTTKMKFHGITDVVLFGNAAETGKFIRQIRGSGFSPNVFVGSTGVLEDFQAIVGCDDVIAMAAENPIYTMETPDAIAQGIIDQGIAPRDVAIFTAEAVMVIADALKNIPPLSPQDISTYLKFNGADTSYEHLNFTNNGELESPKVNAYRYECLDRNKNSTRLIRR